MMQGVTVRNPAPTPVNRREVLRYAGMRGEPDAALQALLEACLAEARDGLFYRVCYTECAVKSTPTGVDFGEFQVNSADLARCLNGVHRAILFAATVGPLPDRMVARYGSVAPTRALLHQAIGAERIEALCDAFLCALGEERGISLRPRFSPGYGDLPLALQRDIFRVLEPTRHIGVSLTDALLMAPTKSVTAIVGIENAEKE